MDQFLCYMTSPIQSLFMVLILIHSKKDNNFHDALDGFLFSHFSKVACIEQTGSWENFNFEYIVLDNLKMEIREDVAVNGWFWLKTSLE